MFAASVVALLAIVLLSGSRRLEPDEIIREYGDYTSPGNRFRVVVQESDNGMITVGFVPGTSWRSITERLTSPAQTRRIGCFTEFEFERDWFLCFDEYDRLWVFTGRRAPEIEARPTSSGGTKPRVQSVMMKGFSLHRGRPISTEEVVSGTGDWRGVPREFFEQIPGKDDPSVVRWGENPPIPKDPPDFTPAERAAIAAYWRNFDRARRTTARRIVWTFPVPGRD